MRPTLAIAISAARAQLRRMGLAPEQVTGKDALAVLDDLSRTEPDLLACQWYASAPERAIRKFQRRWRK